MLTLLLSVALAGDLVVDAKLPVEIRNGGLPVAEVFLPAVVRVPLAAGPTELVLFVNGKPQPVQVDVPEVGETWVIVGRTGVTTGAPPPPPPATGSATVKVELRAAGPEPVMVQVGDQRVLVHPGEPQQLDLSRGRTPVKVRSADGTAVWATGQLELSGDGPVRVQVSEGRMPEISGEGAQWTTGGR